MNAQNLDFFFHVSLLVRRVALVAVVVQDFSRFRDFYLLFVASFDIILRRCISFLVWISPNHLLFSIFFPLRQIGFRCVGV